MKILVVSSVFPSPPNAGDKNRIHHFLDYLARHHDVTLVTMFMDGVDDPQQIISLKERVKELRVIHINRMQVFIGAVSGLIWSTPAVVTSYRQPEFDRSVRELILEKPDIGLLYQLRSARVQKFFGKIPTILDYTDCLYLGYLEYAKKVRNPFVRLFFQYEAMRLKKYEADIGKRVTSSLITSKVDQDGLTSLGVSNITVLQNGVALPDTVQLNNDHTAIFIGNPAYPPNRQALEYILKEVWPNVIKQVLDAKLLVVGRRVPKLEQYFAKLPGVSFTGPIDSLADVYKGVSVSLSPVFSGTGIRNKILEAWSYAKVVIATSKGVSGLPIQSGREAIIEESAEAMTKALIDVWQNSNKYHVMRIAGRKLVEKDFSWEQKNHQLESDLQAAITSSRS